MFKQKVIFCLLFLAVKSMQCSPTNEAQNAQQIQPFQPSQLYSSQLNQYQQPGPQLQFNTGIRSAALENFDIPQTTQNPQQPQLPQIPQYPQLPQYPQQYPQVPQIPNSLLPQTYSTNVFSNAVLPLPQNLPTAPGQPPFNPYALNAAALFQNAYPYGFNPAAAALTGFPANYPAFNYPQGLVNQVNQDQLGRVAYQNAQNA